MPFGDVLSKANNLTLETTDKIRTVVGKNILEKLGIRLLGIPHIGLRCRAYCIFQLIGSVKNKKILDAGCGIGVYSLTLSRQGNFTLGVDIDRSKVVLAASIANTIGASAEFICGDIQNLSVQPIFDIAICSDVLEHVDNDRLALHNLSAAIKPGGIIVLTVPCAGAADLDEANHMGHVRLGYSKAQICSLMESAGLEPVEIIGYCGALGQTAWKLNRWLFRSKLLTALTFWPLYALTILDIHLKPRNVSGWAIKAIKQMA